MGEVWDEIVEWLQSEDLFLIKYGLIISNFMTILLLLFFSSRKSASNQQVYKIDHICFIQMANVLLVTAHPDDESMFFIPTIETLKKQGYKLHLLCMTNGNGEGLGKIREFELEKCCKYLKIDKYSLITNENIQDGMKQKWPQEEVQRIIENYIQQNEIKGVVTFDQNGVSGHINHIACYESILRIKEKQQELKVEKIYVLESTNIVRKYISILDFFISTISSENVLVQLNPLRAWRAMQIHRSQFVWYRKLFVVFSRYAYVNTLKRIL